MHRIDHINKEGTTKNEEKRNIKYSYMALGDTCSFMGACLRCLTLVDTNVLVFVLCCSVQGRLKAFVLFLRYVDTEAFGAWFVPSCAEEKQVRRTKTSWLLVCLGSHMAINSRADDTATVAMTASPRRAPPQQSCSPRYSPVP